MSTASTAEPAPTGAELKTEIRVRPFETADRDAWERFVDACPEATFFHRAGWRDVIENVFRHRTYFRIAESSRGIEGVLPLGHVESRLFGSSLISTPFGVYGGAVANSDSARRALEDDAQALADRLGVDYLEMRHRTAHRSDWLTKELYFTFRKAIAADHDQNLSAIPRKQRAMVRKGIKAGLEAAIDDDIGRLYDAYAESVRNLGTPVFPKRYFRALQDAFGDDCEVLTVTKNGRIVSSVMSFYFRDEVVPFYGGGTAEARGVKGNDFMYWEVMKRAADRGCRLFDYGRSKVGTGAYSFKKNWGFEPEPLPYQYHLVRARELPNVSPANPKYRLLIAAWQRLPLPLSKILGPLLSGSLA